MALFINSPFLMQDMFNGFVFGRHKLLSHSNQFSHKVKGMCFNMVELWRIITHYLFWRIASSCKNSGGLLWWSMKASVRLTHFLQEVALTVFRNHPEITNITEIKLFIHNAFLHLPLWIDSMSFCLVCHYVLTMYSMKIIDIVTTIVSWFQFVCVYGWHLQLSFVKFF